MVVGMPALLMTRFVRCRDPALWQGLIVTSREHFQRSGDVVDVWSEAVIQDADFGREMDMERTPPTVRASAAATESRSEAGKSQMTEIDSWLGLTCATPAAVVFTTLLAHHTLSNIITAGTKGTTDPTRKASRPHQKRHQSARYGDRVHL